MYRGLLIYEADVVLRLLSSGMCSRVVLCVGTSVSEEAAAAIYIYSDDGQQVL